jgi:hypothetical protein
MYDGAGGDPLLYFKHVTQFVELTKTHALRMNKKEILCPCKKCENNVSRSPANARPMCLSHLSMGTFDSSIDFIEFAEETINGCKLVL